MQIVYLSFVPAAVSPWLGIINMSRMTWIDLAGGFLNFQHLSFYLRDLFSELSLYQDLQINDRDVKTTAPSQILTYCEEP